ASPASRLGHAGESTLADDDVIQHADADQLAGAAESIGERGVLGRGRWIAARMVVDEHEGRRRQTDCRREDLAWMHERGGERSLRHAELGEKAVPAIEQQDEELLALALRQPTTEMRVDGGRVAEGFAEHERGSRRAAAELECGADDREAAAPAAAEERRELC